MAEDTFKEFYPKLLQILPVDFLTDQFYCKKLLSSDDKDKLDLFTNRKEKAKYFLDEVIERGLKIDYTDQFYEMLRIMSKSDNPPVKFLADEIDKSCGVAPPLMVLHDQARTQDIEPRGKKLLFKCSV